ncbi:MFS transporter [Caldovatus sediminis]|uniref:MFS transporter n=1 Tax=Caldovatus sediminis TaxID=2041189 RepID=A0A8J2ZEW4_9PROT|nr:2-dehydro-3-deoxygalactonokinase [Caldovatus sediminis]GGG48295.1 MFS transporter [Caldovatus sediminis]
MIGVDWGTSSLRAYRLAADGTVCERREAERGVLTVPPGGFPAVLREAVGDWIAAGEDRVLLCGMVGSRQGWVEAPYLACPAGVAEIAGATIRVPFEGPARVRLVPGLATRDAAGVPEVMRGEETKVVGLLAAIGAAPEATLCLPGTHCKWVRIRAGRVAGFATYMTGEAFAALSAHTILARSLDAEAPPHPGAFDRGAARARQKGGLLHHLFGVRALALTGELPPDQAGSYLSGLLIGHEVAAALEAGVAPPVHLAGAESLVALYRRALGAFGIPCRIHDADAAARGLALIGGRLDETDW